jgi:outer membrane protein OmpA-like peptidoglycan-associated protein
VRTELASERDTLRTRLDEQDEAHAAALGEANERLELLSATLAAESLQAEQDTLAVQLAELKAALAAEREARQALAAERRAEAEQLADLRAELAEAREALAAAEQALAEQDASHGERIAGYQQRLGETEAELSAMRTELAEREAALEQRLQGSRAAAEQAAQQVEAFYGRFAELGAQLTDEGLLIRLAGDELRFASGSAALPEETLPTLERLAAALQQHPQLRVRIEGHTDSSGTAALNRSLSEQRAAAVRRALVERGVAPERLTVEGHGAERPIADNASAEGRQRNRRVEVHILRGDDTSSG